MKLFYSPGACSLAPHIVLQEAGLAYTLEKVSLKTNTLEDGTSLKTITPKNYVPALLLDSGEVLTEGPAIVQYLADLVPDKAIAPRNGSMERYRMQSWLTYIGTEIHKAFPPFFHDGGTQWKAEAKANLEKAFALVNEHLADKDYLLGTQFSVADPYLFTVTRWAKVAQIDIKAHYPNLAAFQERMSARPHVREVLIAEGLIR